MPRELTQNTAYWLAHPLTDILSNPRPVHTKVLEAIGLAQAAGDNNPLEAMRSVVDSPLGVFCTTYSARGVRGVHTGAFTCASFSDVEVLCAVSEGSLEEELVEEGTFFLCFLRDRLCFLRDLLE